MYAPRCGLYLEWPRSVRKILNILGGVVDRCQVKLGIIEHRCAREFSLCCDSQPFCEVLVRPSITLKDTSGPHSDEKCATTGGLLATTCCYKCSDYDVSKLIVSLINLIIASVFRITKVFLG